MNPSDMPDKDPPPRGEISAAWECASLYHQVLLAYLVCARHLAPTPARTLLQEFFGNPVICKRLAEESHKTGVCFRTLTLTALDVFLLENRVETTGTTILPREDQAVFFNRRWARLTMQEALRRVAGICRQEKRPELFNTLLDDFAGLEYGRRKPRQTMRQMYLQSEIARQIFIRQLEAALLITISDRRLIMQEWQELHNILPDEIALDPEMATQHKLSTPDLALFWQEFTQEKLNSLNCSLKQVIAGEVAQPELLKQARTSIRQAPDNRHLPNELVEAATCACLSAELLLGQSKVSEFSGKALARGLFWLSRQSWVDTATAALAVQAELRLQELSSALDWHFS